MDLSSSVFPELEDLADQVGEFIHYWGFKKVHGRIWTHLFLSNRALDASDIVNKMRISKALVSISLRELLEYEVVILAGRSEKGTQLYRNNPDILKVILNVLRQREKRLLSRVQSSQASLSRVKEEDLVTHDLSRAKVDTFASLMSNATQAMDGLLDLSAVDFGIWRSIFMTDGGTDATAASDNLAESLAASCPADTILHKNLKAKVRESDPGNDSSEFFALPVGRTFNS